MWVGEGGGLPYGALLLIAYGLDLLLGDPPWLPHPVRAMAWLAHGCEAFWRGRLSRPRLAGVVTVLSVVAGVAGVVAGVVAGALWIHPWAHDLVVIYVLYSAFAARDLARHALTVHAALTTPDLELARQRVAMIVGRETALLDEAGVARATVESVAENMVDGVTAPLLWAALFGPVGVLVYKAVNTMDSLFGYKNERYLEFGWAPARLDDLLNYLPARLTALLVVCVAPLLGHSPGKAYQIWRRDRRCHASPNSAQTEAAVAGALGIQLGGPAVYFGQLLAKPTIGDADQPLKARHILDATQLMLLTCGGMALLAGVGSWFMA
jgi:adenosylcobinamide-phosphate synthase